MNRGRDHIMMINMIERGRGDIDSLILFNDFTIIIYYLSNGIQLN